MMTNIAATNIKVQKVKMKVNKNYSKNLMWKQKTVSMNNNNTWMRYFDKQPNNLWIKNLFLKSRTAMVTL